MSFFHLEKGWWFSSSIVLLFMKSATGHMNLNINTLQECKNIRFKNNSTWIYYYDFNTANKVYTFKSTTSTCAYFTLTYNRHSHNLEWLNKKFYSIQGFATCFEIYFTLMYNRRSHNLEWLNRFFYSATRYRKFTYF